MLPCSDPQAARLGSECPLTIIMSTVQGGQTSHSDPEPARHACHHTVGDSLSLFLQWCTREGLDNIKDSVPSQNVYWGGSQSEGQSSQTT